MCGNVAYLYNLARRFNNITTSKNKREKRLDKRTYYLKSFKYSTSHVPLPLIYCLAFVITFVFRPFGPQSLYLDRLPDCALLCFFLKFENSTCFSQAILARLKVCAVRAYVFCSCCRGYFSRL